MTHNDCNGRNVGASRFHEILSRSYIFNESSYLFRENKHIRTFRDMQFETKWFYYLELSIIIRKQGSILITYK